MLALPALLAAAACRNPEPALALDRAAIAVAPGVSPALYLTLRNVGRRPLDVVGARVSVARSATIQTTTAHRMAPGDAALGPTSMFQPVAAVRVDGGATMRFAPGGFGIVLEGLSRPLVVGESLGVSLELATGPAVTTMARVVAFAELDTVLAPATSATGGTPSIEEGRALYASDGCAACHGVDGHGDGPQARTLAPPPRDFRNAAAFRNGITEDAIAQTLATGIPNGGAMPLFAHLNVRERRSLAQFVISLRTSPSPTRAP